MATPHAFLCHSSDDKDVVARLAEDLQANGVQAWYDDWCIAPGDSLRRKIDEGLRTVTHFLAILSPRSLESEWVQTELDAALVHKSEGSCTLIPVLLELSADDVPPTLRGAKWIRLDDYDAGFHELLGTLHGASRMPPLGAVPERFTAVLNDSLGLSTDAQRVARFVCEQGTHGHPTFVVSYDALCTAMDLGSDDIELAVDELVDAGLLKDGQSYASIVMPEWDLFFQLDPMVHGWDPEKDAISVAAEVVNHGDSGISLQDLASRLEWDARRLNPACAMLAEQDLVMSRQFMGGGPFFYGYLRRTTRTRRFVRDNS